MSMNHIVFSEKPLKNTKKWLMTSIQKYKNKKNKKEFNHLEGGWERTLHNSARAKMSTFKNDLDNPNMINFIDFNFQDPANQLNISIKF